MKQSVTLGVIEASNFYLTAIYTRYAPVTTVNISLIVFLFTSFDSAVVDLL